MRTKWNADPDPRNEIENEKKFERQKKNFEQVRHKKHKNSKKQINALHNFQVPLRGTELKE